MSSKALFLSGQLLGTIHSTSRVMPFCLVASVLVSFPLMQSTLRLEILRDLELFICNL